MDEIKTLITAIGDFFTKSDWYSMVKWPFWILLTIVAAGGVYTARFGKKNLICPGINGTLNVITLYLFLALAYSAYAPLRTMISELPFLAVTDKSVTAVNPWGLSLAAIPPLMLRLMILIFLLNLTDSFSLYPKTIVTWVLVQVADTLVALFFYAVITAGIGKLLPSLLGRFALIPVVLVLLVGVVMVCAKFVFTVIIKEPNTYFTAVYKFFTTNRFGSACTISTVSFLLVVLVLTGPKVGWNEYVVLVLTMLNTLGCAVMTYENINRMGIVIIFFLCTAVQYIFSMFYSDRKKG